MEIKDRASEECTRCHMRGLEINHLVNIVTLEEEGHLWKCDNCGLGHLFHDKGEYIPNR